MTRIYLFLLLNLAFFLNFSSASAQFSRVEIGVDGLTCSMCTRSTEMSIRKLDFVDSVKMDLTNTKGIITFKKDKKVSVEKIAKAVKDAGFSVRYLKATASFNAQPVNNEGCFTYDGEQYKLLGKGSDTLNGEKIMTFAGKEFMPAKEFKKREKELKSTCGTEKKVYYVML